MTDSTESKTSKLKGWCSALLLKVKEKFQDAYAYAKAFTVKNPMFVWISFVLLISAIVIPDFAVLMLLMGMLTAMSFFWYHCLTMLANTMGAANAVEI